MRLSGRNVLIEVYNEQSQYVGQADVIVSMRATRRHLAPSTAQFEIDPRLPIRDRLVEDGAQVAIQVDGELFLSGWVTSDGGSIDPAEPLTYQVTGHDFLGWSLLGWPVPGAPLSGQNVAYWRRRTAAETALKDAISANASSRLGLPVTVAPDLARGGQVDVSLRFHPLMDRMATQLNSAGVGMTASLVRGQGIEVDVYETRTHRRIWDPRSGVIVGGGWQRNKPSLSRVVAGSQGEAEARSFFGPVVADWESSMGSMLIEGFVDARDIGGDEGDTEEEVETRMWEKLNEGAATHDLALELDSAPGFAYQTGWNVGDTALLAPRPDVVIPAQLQAAELSISDESGVRVRPVVGFGDDPTLRALGPVIKSVAQLGRAYRDLTRR